MAETELARLRAGIILISHDRRLLSGLSKSMIWLDRGVTRRVDRGFSDYDQWREEILAQEEAEHHKLGRQIAREEDWMRYGVTGSAQAEYAPRGRASGAPPTASGTRGRGQGRPHVGE